MESKVVWNKMFLELITKGSAVSAGLGDKLELELAGSNSFSRRDVCTNLGYKLELELAQRNSFFSLDEKFGTTPMHASLRKKFVLS